MSGDCDDPVFYDADIFLDYHFIEFSDKVARNTNAPPIRYVFKRNEMYTCEGLKAIAQRLREDPVIQTLIVLEEFVTAQSIVEVMKVLYLEGNLQRLHKIRICNERAQLLFDYFRVGQNDKHMKQCHIPNNTTSWRGSSMEFVACLHGNTHLQRLEVNIDADFAPDDVSALATGMCKSQLKELRLYNSCTLYTTMKGDFFQILCRDGIQASGRIWECLEIDAYHSCVNDMSPVTEVIPFVKTLRIYRIDRNSQTRNEMYCLSEGFERSCNLVRLGLVDCGLNSDDMRILCRALRHHRSLKELDLAYNGLGDAGVSVLMEHWDEHPILESLNVKSNWIRSTGIQQLINAVVNRPSMRLLKMDLNEFGFNEVHMIAEHLPNLRLKVLGLHVFPYNMDGNKQCVYQTLLRGLKANCFLHKLGVTQIFWEEFGNELSFYIELSKHGRYLITDINAVAPTIWCTILTKCRGHDSFCHSMMFYFLREQPHLVRPMLMVVQNVVQNCTLTF